MTYQEFLNKLTSGEKWNIGVSINRNNAIPLDASSVFTSKEALDNYAKGNPPKGHQKNAYPGQLVAVATESETIVYYIDSTFTPQEVGIKLTGDESTINIEGKKVSLHGFESADNNTIVIKDGDGNLLWEKIDNITSINGVDADDSILSVEDRKIKSSVSIAYDSTNGLIELLGIDNKVLSFIKASDLFGEGLIEDIEYNDETDTLVFKWKTASGTKSAEVQLTNLLKPYESGNGVIVDGSKINIKVDESSDPYISVGKNGLKISGIDKKLEEYCKTESIDKYLFEIDNDGFRIIDGGRLEP